MRPFAKDFVNESGCRIHHLGHGGCNVDGGLGDELANGVGYGFAPSEEEGAELGDKRVLALLAGTSITKSSLVPGTKKELVMARFLAVDMDDSMQGIKVGEGKRRARSGRR